MTKNEILLKLIDLGQRAKAIHRIDAKFGWELLEVEKEIKKLEETLAEQVDTFMANQYRLFNSKAIQRSENEDVTVVPRRGGRHNDGYLVSGFRKGAGH